jgi:hypothetical protein
MSENIGGFGLSVNLVAIPTFPTGLTISQFADDADPFDIPSIPIRDAAMGLNGDLVSWGKATPVTITMNVIAGSDDDINLSILANLNRVGQGKTASNDTVNLIASYPDGTIKALFNGVMTDAPLGSSVSSAGRFKSKTYSFKFENIV